MNSGRALGGLVIFRVASGFHDGLEGDLAGVSGLGIGSMSPEGGEEARYAFHQIIVDLLLVLQGLNLVSPLLTLGVDLVLLGTDK